MHSTLSSRAICFIVALLTASALQSSLATPLPGTAPLIVEGDLAEQMVAGIHADLDARTVAAKSARTAKWTASAASEGFAPVHREKLRVILGAVDPRLPVAMETVSAPGKEGPIAVGDAYRVYAVRWPVYQGAWGEGLLVEPNGDPRASLVLLPDADESPESLLGLAPGNAYAVTLAEQGNRILIPTLANRADTWSGHPDVRMTNQPHREFIYRAAYEMGRHVIGYEIQKVLSALDWLQSKSAEAPIGLMGYGEGGLIALHTAALDTRVQATVVSGYFGPREGLWTEPIYRNVWSLLTDFGNAEVAALIAPRALIVESATPPAVTGPPATEGRSGAAPGVVPNPSTEEIQSEVAQALTYVPVGEGTPWLQRSAVDVGLPGQPATLEAFSSALGLDGLPATASSPRAETEIPDAEARMKRQVEGMLGWTDHILAEAPFARESVWKEADASSAEAWAKSVPRYRKFFHEQLMGKLPQGTVPLNPRTREIYDTEKFTGYEVMLDVNEQVYAYGILLLPKNIAPGEKRPVVVCQHGLEGRPQEVTDPASDSHYYHRFGAKLAEEGFIVYAPQNPYIGEDHFRTLQRKANPLKLSLFSYIIEQHRRTLEWLGALPEVDPARIAFYGLSYGGKTAMRVPAVLDGYCLSICSGDYNEWIWKNVTRRRIYSYVFHGEYEMFEWNLGNTFNYAEMSWLICPRPFMVERGHDDGVAPGEWVSYEYARTRERYDRLGLGDETTIEYFNGPHTIHGVGTFQFLRDKLKFPVVTQ